MAKPVTAERIIEEMKQSLKDFGTYSFDDKGPQEVMHLEPITNAIRMMEVKDAVAIIQKVAESPEGEEKRARVVAARLVYSLQSWDELFEQGGDLIGNLYDEA